MKKKFLSFILAICLIIPCAFMLSACGENPQNLTNAEMAVVYKDAAKSAWNKMGVSDPTIETSNLLLSAVPDKKQNATDKNDILQVKLNANNMASILYLIGALYENANFVITDGYAKFSAEAEIFDQSFEYDLTIEPKLDVKNNKLYLAAYIVVNKTNSQYIVVDANYDFGAKELKSFRMFTKTEAIYIDIGMDEKGINKFFATMDGSDDFAVAVDAENATFITNTETITKIDFDFSIEFQEYMTLSQKVVEELGG